MTAYDRTARILFDTWRAESARLVLWAPVFVGVGIGAYFSMQSEPSLWWALLIVPAFVAWRLAEKHFGTAGAVIPAALLCIAIGFAAAAFRTNFLATAMLDREVPFSQIEGRVADVTPLANGAARIVLELSNAATIGLPIGLRARILIRGIKGPLTIGQWLHLRATLRPLPRPVAPGAYDFARALWFKGIGATGFALGTMRQIPAQGARQWNQWAVETVESIRHHLSARIKAAVSPQNGAVATAFLTGERTAIDEEMQTAFRDSSLAHLLSISGLHMVLAGFGFFTALRIMFALVPNFAQRVPVKKLAAIGALIASAAYLVISGAAIPTQRSFIMIALGFLAMLIDRPAISLRLVALAAMGILLLLPESLLDVSFQMSFAAVIGLVSAFEWWQSRSSAVSLNRISDRIWGWFSGAVSTSAIAGLATTPFAAFHFNRITDYGVIANVAALPIVGFVVMPAGVIGLVLAPFGLEALPLAIMDYGLTWIVAIAREVAGWPGSAHSTASFSGASLIAMICGGLWLCIWSQPWRLLGLVFIVAGVALMPWRDAPDALIADGGRTFAMRLPDGHLALSSARKDRFAARAWLSFDGDGRTVLEANKAGSGVMQCDDFKCTADLGAGRKLQQIISVGSEGKPHPECIDANIIVDHTGAARGCKPDALVLRGDWLRKQGAVALRFRNGRWKVTTVAQSRGDRPWSAPRTLTPEQER
jgi:competence protein ComEC